MAEQDTTIETGPGACLAARREEAGLSVEQVAAHLKLTAQKIREIEADNFEPHTPMIFYRGYLKSYAALVNVPAAEIIDRFNGLAVSRGLTDAELLLDGTRPGEDNRSGTVRLIVVTLILVLAAATYWFARDAGALPWRTDATNPGSASAPVSLQPKGIEASPGPARTPAPVKSGETPEPASTPTGNTEAAEPPTFTLSE